MYARGMSNALIGHLDADCFYVSAERVRFPALQFAADGSQVAHDLVRVLANQGEVSQDAVEQLWMTQELQGFLALGIGHLRQGFLGGDHLGDRSAWSCSKWVSTRSKSFLIVCSTTSSSTAAWLMNRRRCLAA